MSLILISFLFMGIVSADTEPNSDPMSAESIGMGTHTGSVYEIGDDTGDWYKVENIGEKTVKVSVKILDFNDGEYVTVDSYGAWAVAPDGQIGVYVGHEDKEDSCHWDDTDGLGTMYLYVTGNGEYELEIAYEGDDDKGNITCLFVIGGIILALMFGIAIAIMVMKYFGKKRLINKMK
jgi:hypothetical protein